MTQAFNVPAKLKAQAEMERRRRQWKADCRRYRDDPIGYARHMLGMELTADQGTMLNNVVRHRRSGCKAAHAVGKSVVAGILANHWHDCFETSICYVTAPTWTAARDRTFKQARLIREERVPLYARGRILETGKIEDSDPTLKLKHFIQAINAESGEGFQGEHSARILVILEEAVGVPAYIWEAADKGLMTAAENRLFAIANPTDEATLFGAYCADGDTCIITVSALDHPNIQAELHGQPAPFPGACSLTWLYDELKRECEPARPGDPGAFEFWSLSTIRACLDGAPIGAQERPAMAWYLPNAIFQGRVLGLFPQEANQQVIPPSWLEHLARLEPDRSELPEVGADIARHGDDRTGIATRWGACLYGLEVLRQMSLEVVTDNIRLAIHAAATLDGSNFDPKSIPCRIDITGGLGAGPYDRLAAEGYSVIGVNSSETAIDDENYPNKRSELWFSTREMVRARQFDDSRLPPDTRSALRRELSTPKWKPDAKGRKVVDPKKDTKKILKWSPDLADAVLLAYYAGEPPRHLERVDASGLEIDFARLGGRG